MKRILLILAILFSVLCVKAQDTVYVYQAGGMVQINNLESNPIFMTPGNVSYRLRGSNFVLKDGLTKQEYTVGSYNEIFNSDTIGFSTQESTIDYLNSILNLATTDVFINDQTTPPFQYYLMYEQKDDITLTENTFIDSSFCLVSSGHGFTGTGEYIVIMENNRYEQLEVISTSNDSVFLSETLDFDFTTNATVIRGIIDMNVDADTTAILFKCLLRNNFTIPIDIQTVKLTMQHSTSADDSKFGDLTELTNGLRFKKTNSSIQGLGNYSSNQDFKEFGAAVIYEDKAGGGNHSTTVVFDVKTIYGIVIRLNPREGDCFNALTQDDLDGLLRLRVSIMGQYTSGE